MIEVLRLRPLFYKPSKIAFFSDFLIFCPAFVDVNNGYDQVTMLILRSEERFISQRKIYGIHETSDVFAHTQAHVKKSRKKYFVKADFYKFQKIF